MSDRYRIRFQEWIRLIPEIDASGARLVVWEGEESRAVSVLIAGPHLLQIPVLAHRTTPVQLKLGVGTEESLEGLDDAFLKFAIARIEQLLRDRRVGSESLPSTIQVDEVDLATIASMLDEKNCRYQLEQDGDLYCAAAASNDQTIIGSIGLRRLAPTSRPICGRCEMPDAEYICSHLAHPEVYAIVASGGLHKRNFMGAFCELNQPGIESPGACRADGHACWERIVDVRRSDLDVRPSPTALPEALDHLDVIWRLAFGKRSGLLRLRTATDTVGLALTATSREELEVRTSDLAEALDDLVVDDELLPEDLANEKKKGSINRLEASLSHHLPAESFGALAPAIATLRAVFGVRVAFQHAHAAQRLPEALGRFGISYPPRDYGLTWDTIRAHVIDALASIRDALRRWSLE